MFNQLTSADVVTAVGRTLRTTARSDDRSSEFERDQLLSAYSATRHLAVELACFTPVLEAYTSSLLAILRTAGPTDSALTDDVAAIVDRIEADSTPAGLGAAISDLLARLRDDGDPTAAPAAAAIRRLTRRLADDEVDLLADGLDRR